MHNNLKFNTIQLFLISCIIFIPFGLLAQNQNFDSYGGCKDINFDEGTGFFRLGEIDGKHFLVTPKGNGFRSIGLNHTHMVKTTNYDEIIEDLKSMGFNSGDYQGPQWMWNKVPYSKGINLLETSTWLPENKFKFEDVFDPAFITSLEAKIKSIVAPQANNDMLICYFLTDIPAWSTEKYGMGWIDFFNSLDENAPGKKEFEKWKAANLNAPEEDFIPLIAKQVYVEGTALIRKYDNNHLIFSDKYHEYNFSEKVALEVLPYVDGIAIQPKNFLSMEFFDYVYEKFGKPVFVADHVSSYATEEYSNTMAQVADNPYDYLEFYRNSVYDVMSKPYIVGYNKCQYMDQVNGTQLKQGLYRTNGEPYEYVVGLKEAHQRALDTAYTVSKKKDNGLLDWGKYENVKQEAIQRIEKYRKGDVKLEVTLPNQHIAANTKVRVKLKRHDFKWGAVIRESFFTSPYKELFKETFLRYFNASGFGLELKPKWRGADFEKTIENTAMPWLLKNDIYVRGHALAWEGLNYMRPEDKAIYNDASLTNLEKGEKMLESCGKHFPYAIPKWDVKCWDVSNEPITNNTINDLLPDINSHVHWFKLADSIRRTCGKEDVVLYQNDYQIISAISPWAMDRPARYRKLLDEQIALGAPIEGIGFQSRLKHGLITPDSIYKRLCDFNRYNLPYQATEFEIRNDVNKYVYTDAERRLLTEYMMVMYFSHPKVNGFWHWTFFDVKSNVNWDYSLFNYDGTPKVNGQIWMDLMDSFFATNEETITNANGEVTVRGYYGDYEILVENGNDILIGTFAIDSTDTNPVVPVSLAGKINLSGIEDSEAYAFNQPIEIDISALSYSGKVNSINVLMNFESIGSSTDSSLTLNYTPKSTVEGWNEFTVKFSDDLGNKFSHSIDVFFGNTLPEIEILNHPNDIIYAGSTGNIIEFSVTENYSAIESIKVSYAERNILLNDQADTFDFNIDDLSVGDYQFTIEVIDNMGEKVSETVSFKVELPENILPTIEITSPEASTFYYGAENTLTLNASDGDGTISIVEIYLNNSLSYTFTESPYSFNLDTLSIGDYEIIAIATDDRNGQASDTIIIKVEKNVSFISELVPGTTGIVIHPNPVSNTLYFSLNCNYEIYSIIGSRILEGKDVSQVDVSTLKNGLYLAKTNYGIFKLMKQ